MLKFISLLACLQTVSPVNINAGRTRRPRVRTNTRESTVEVEEPTPVSCSGTVKTLEDMYNGPIYAERLDNLFQQILDESRTLYRNKEEFLQWVSGYNDLGRGLWFKYYSQYDLSLEKIDAGLNDTEDIDQLMRIILSWRAVLGLGDPHEYYNGRHMQYYQDFSAELCTDSELIEAQNYYNLLNDEH